MSIKLSLLVFVFILFSSIAQAQTATSECPTTGPTWLRQGYGAGVDGGCRSGRSIVTVTNLNNSGAGSLRNAIETGSNKLVIADPSLSGWIDVAAGGDIIVTGDNITVDLQDAAGAGIGIYSSTDTNLVNAAIEIDTGADNIILRNFHVAVNQFGADDIQTRGVGVILDHLSLTRAGDELAPIIATGDLVTMQWCMLFHGFDNGLGALIDGSFNAPPVAPRVSWHHNVIIHSGERNPGIFAPASVEVINNVWYDTFVPVYVNWNRGTGSRDLDLIKNYYKLSGNDANNAIVSGVNLAEGGNATIQIFASGNTRDSGTTILHSSVSGSSVGSRINPSPTITEDIAADLVDNSKAAYLLTVQKVGPRNWHSEEVAAMNDAINKTGSLLHTNVGWTPPSMTSAAASRTQSGGGRTAAASRSASSGKSASSGRTAASGRTIVQ